MIEPDKCTSSRVCFIMILAVSLIYGAPFSSFFYNHHKNPVTGIGGAEANLSYTANLLYIEGQEQENLRVITEGIPEPEQYSKAQLLLCTAYRVKRGDTISAIARDFGLNQDSLISLNGIRDTRVIQINQLLKIPNQDGILHKVRNGETLSDLAKKYESDIDSIKTSNELFGENINTGSSIFIPGAKLDRVTLHEINGDLFIWPVRGYITSNYGYRQSPFASTRQFHTGIDIGAYEGTPVTAAMAGRVSNTGYDAVSGNYVVLTHHSGYRTLYAHLSVIRVKTGTYVRTGDRIGDVGNTGLSTGAHLHFTVYKNGVTVNPRALIK